LSPSEEIKNRIRDAVRVLPAPARPVTRRSHLLALGLAAAMLTVLLFVLGGFSAGDRPLGFVAATSSGWVALAAGVSWLALGRGGRMGGRPTVALIAGAIGAPVLLFGWLLVCNLLYAPTACPPGVSPFGTACHELIVAMSAVMFAAFAFIRRFADPVHPKSAGAALAVASASWAGLVLNLRCTCATPLHVGVGHVLPLAVASAAGVALGHWLLRVRAPRTP
jgi:hypothetical protein